MRNVKLSILLSLLVMAVWSGVSLSCSSDEYDESIGLKTMARRKVEPAEFHSYYVKGIGNDSIEITTETEYSKYTIHFTWEDGTIRPPQVTIHVGNVNMQKKKEHENEISRKVDVETITKQWYGLSETFNASEVTAYVRVNGVTNILYAHDERIDTCKDHFTLEKETTVHLYSEKEWHSMNTQ